MRNGICVHFHLRGGVNHGMSLENCYWPSFPAKALRRPFDPATTRLEEHYDTIPPLTFNFFPPCTPRLCRYPHNRGSVQPADYYRIFETVSRDAAFLSREVSQFLRGL